MFSVRCGSKIHLQVLRKVQVFPQPYPKPTEFNNACLGRLSNQGCSFQDEHVSSFQGTNYRMVLYYGKMRHKATHCLHKKRMGCCRQADSSLPLIYYWRFLNKWTSLIMVCCVPSWSTSCASSWSSSNCFWCSANLFTYLGWYSLCLQSRKCEEAWWPNGLRDSLGWM